MGRYRVLPYLLILLQAACVDRFYETIAKPEGGGISISGFITNQPGPYEIRLYTLYDIESKESMRTAVSAKWVVIQDNAGNQEQLTEVNPGIYQTAKGGIKGEIGRVYQLQLELANGTIIESLPDTLTDGGSLDSIYFSYQRDQYSVTGQRKFGLTTYFDASYDAEVNNRFIWRFEATFKSETQPESNHSQCFYTEDAGKCNFIPPCSGYRNIGSIREPRYERKFPCTCCTCWYSVYNDYAIVSDELVRKKGELKGVELQQVPVNEWTMYYKLRVAVSQLSLSYQSFRFWRAIKSQKEGVTSLFQPVTGRVPVNFRQMGGSTMNIQGIFFAARASEKVVELNRDNIPLDIMLQLPTEKPFFGDDCRLLFPHSSNIKPGFWVD